MMTHEFPEGADRCVHCGTLRTSTGQTACPGPQRHDAATLRPSGAAEYAANDSDTISRRLAELHAERTAAMNEPAKD